MEFQSAGAAGGGGNVPNLQTSETFVLITGSAASDVLVPAPASGQIQLFGLEIELSLGALGPGDQQQNFGWVAATGTALPTGKILAELSFTLPDLAAGLPITYPPQALYVAIPGLILPAGVELTVNTGVLSGLIPTLNGACAAVAYYNIV